MDREIYFPRRLYSVAVGGAAAHRESRDAGYRHGNPASALRRDAQAMARTIPRPPRTGRAHLQSALRADVGVLFGRVRNVVPRAGLDGVPGPAHQAAGRGADDARLYRPRGAPVARRRRRASPAAAARRRVGRGNRRARAVAVKTKPILFTADLPL